MLLILWFHTEVYYTGRDIISYNLYVCNALTVFYFISGYLFFNEKLFSWKHKLHSIYKGLILPYFFFTLLLALPKSLVRDVSLTDIFIDIIIGKGSWFVASLIVCELVMIILGLLKRKSVIYITQIACLLLAYLLIDTNFSIYQNYWNVHSALIGMFFLCLGYEYRVFEKQLECLHHFWVFILVLLLFIATKVYVIWSGASLIVSPVIISSFPLFIADSILGILLLITLFRKIPNISWLNWTGKHSLVYYFFCGAVPTVVALGLNIIHLPFIESQYYRMFIAFLLVYALSSGLVWISYEYLPMLKRKKLT